MAGYNFAPTVKISGMLHALAAVCTVVALTTRWGTMSMRSTMYDIDMEVLHLNVLGMSVIDPTGTGTHMSVTWGDAAASTCAENDNRRLLAESIVSEHMATQSLGVAGNGQGGCRACRVLVAGLC